MPRAAEAGKNSNHDENGGKGWRFTAGSTGPKITTTSPWPTGTGNCWPGARASVWCATKLATDAGGWRQINRFGHPMMWPIFWPDDTDFSDPANTRHPSEDFNAVGKYIGDQVAAVVSASGTSDDPQGYGQTVARRLFPDVMPYLVGTPATYGFAAFNGRTQADNAPEAMLSLVANTAVPSGLKPSVADHLRDSNFPYIVPA